MRTRKDKTLWTFDPPRTGYKDPYIAPKEQPRTLVPAPTDPVEQNNLGSDLLAWSNTDAAEAIEQFPLNLKMSPYRFYDIAITNPYFADCLDAARAAIGFRRERNARTRKEDSATIMKMQPLYNKEYKSLSLEKSSAEATKVGTVIQVIESKIEDSPMVPLRIRDEG